MDHVYALLEHDSGVKSCIEISLGILPITYPFTMDFRIICTEGVLEYSSGSLTMFQGDKSPITLEVEQANGYYREIEYFLNCIKRDEEPTIITAMDAKLALQISLHVREAAETGQIIELS